MANRVTPFDNKGTGMSDRYALLRDKLPPSYVEFIESQDGWEGDLGEEGTGRPDI